MASVGVRGRNGATSVSGGTRRDPGYVVMLWKSCSDLCRSSMLSDFVLVSVSSRFGRAYLCTQGSSRRRSSRAAARRRTLGRRRRRGHQRLSAPVGRGHVEDGRGKSAALLYCLTRREQRPELAGDGRDGILPPSVQLEVRNVWGATARIKGLHLPLLAYARRYVIFVPAGVIPTLSRGGVM